MNISEVARQSGISAKMIRYYEGVGLIPPAKRTRANYRAYSARDVHTLRFICKARDLGFSVEEIGSLLSLWQDGSRKSADVKALAEEHVAALRSKIAGLEQMASTLEHLVDACCGDARPDCPILEELEDATPVPSIDGPGHGERFGTKG